MPIKLWPVGIPDDDDDYKVMAYIVMASIFMTYIVIACIVPVRLWPIGITDDDDNDNDGDGIPDAADVDEDNDASQITWTRTPVVMALKFTVRNRCRSFAAAHSHKILRGRYLVTPNYAEQFCKPFFVCF